jgi:HEAT repeat protein
VLTKIEGDHVAQAISGFDILGEQASPAVPALARLMLSNGSIGPSPWVITALSYVGKDGLPALISALSDPRQQTNRCRVVGAIGAIRNLAPNDQTAAPALIRCLGDPDPMVATAAAQSLGSLASQPESTIPALIRLFEDPKSRLRVASALSLGKFGQKARPAVPALLKAQRDPDRVVRAVAINTLREIAPEIWENAQKSETGADNVSVKGHNP